MEIVSTIGMVDLDDLLDDGEEKPPRRSTVVGAETDGRTGIFSGALDLCTRADGEL